MAAFEVDPQSTSRKLSTYAFQDPALLEQALDPTRNKRLEYLGDAALHLVWVEMMLEESPAHPRDWASLRGDLESNALYARLGQLMFPELSSLTLNLKANVFESVAGAVYLDSGKCLSTLRRAMLEPHRHLWKAYISEFTMQGKTNFIDYIQKKYRFTPRIQVDYLKTGPPHRLLYGATAMRILDSQGQLVQEFWVSVPCRYPTQREVQKVAMEAALGQMQEES